MTKIKCKKCGSQNLDEYDDSIDFDKGTYEVDLKCVDCSTFSKAKFVLTSIH